MARRANYATATPSVTLFSKLFSIESLSPSKGRVKKQFLFPLPFLVGKQVVFLHQLAKWTKTWTSGVDAHAQLIAVEGE